MPETRQEPRTLGDLNPGDSFNLLGPTTPIKSYLTDDDGITVSLTFPTPLNMGSDLLYLQKMGREHVLVQESLKDRIYQHLLPAGTSIKRV